MAFPSAQSLGQMLNLVQYGQRQIFRPSRDVERWIQEGAWEHLQTKFKPGEYRGRAGNELILHQFRFYERLLETALPKLCGRDEMEFLLYQFDEATQLLHGNGILDLREREAWSQVEPHFKRGIKFILERLCMLSAGPIQPSSRKECLLAMNVAVACAEQAAHLAQESDMVHTIFPDDAVVTVYESGPLQFKIKAMGKHEGWSDRYHDRIRRDREYRSEVIEGPPFDFHTETHRLYLDRPFMEAFGADYAHFIEVLLTTIRGCRPSLHPDALPTLLIPHKKLVQELHHLSSMPIEAIKRALAGFTVTAENLKKEARALHKPKQVHRALRRGFFLMSHANEEPHLAFSYEMAMGNLTHLCGSVAFQRLPPEWQAPGIRDGLIALSKEAGQWFEKQLARQLRRLGYSGSRALRQVSQGERSLPIPGDVGEIDFLGIDPVRRVIVVAEAKMIKGGIEPAFWRKEVDEFVKDADSYANRFRKKVAWVAENRDEISAILGGPPLCQIAFALVTLYPSIVQEFLPDMRCVSIAELVLDHERARQWPYAFK